MCLGLASIIMDYSIFTISVPGCLAVPSLTVVAATVQQESLAALDINHDDRKRHQ
jgi:hypothetical protein